MASAHDSRLGVEIYMKPSTLICENDWRLPLPAQHCQANLSHQSKKARIPLEVKTYLE